MLKALSARPFVQFRAAWVAGWLLCSALPGFAQVAPASAATATVAAAASSATAVDRADRSTLQRSVIEDDNVRIEETRLRGLPQRITVHNKTLGGNYEILVGPKGKDPSQNKSTAGQSAWSLFDF